MIIVGAILVSLPIVFGVYAYVLYPAILRILASRRPVTGSGRATNAPLPLVSIVVPAYNEAHQIRDTIESLLAQDYPVERRQILVLSDASSDGTDDIVRQYASRGVELMRAPARAGKTAAENASLALIRGDIVVNTDSSVRLDARAVRLLVDALDDPTVGVASTADVSVSNGDRGNSAEAGYVGYEMGVRMLETRSGGIVGASGSGYAIRIQLHRVRVREDLSRDFSAALTARRHGFRAVSVPDAICYVPRSLSLAREYKRKVRTISRGMETLYYNRELLNPASYGVFAWKLLSHKVCRWLVPGTAPLAVAGLALIAMALPSASWLLVAALALAGLAFAGATWPDDRPVPRWMPTSVLGALAANLAAVHSAWRFFHGHEDHVWEPTRRTGPST
jgi:cellulose synthase/poly-beta-1,6-N-acetylglucosamine synthase-like glycosyltransferase